MLETTLWIALVGLSEARQQLDSRNTTLAVWVWTWSLGWEQEFRIEPAKEHIKQSWDGKTGYWVDGGWGLQQGKEKPLDTWVGNSGSEKEKSIHAQNQKVARSGSERHILGWTYNVGCLVGNSWVICTGCGCFGGGGCLRRARPVERAFAASTL